MQNVSGTSEHTVGSRIKKVALRKRDTNYFFEKSDFIRNCLCKETSLSCMEFHTFQTRGK